MSHCRLLGPAISLAISPNQSDGCDDRNPAQEKHDEDEHNRHRENAGYERSAAKGKRTTAKKAKTVKRRASRRKSAANPKQSAPTRGLK